jgi:uncharacterized protein with GYD domain
MQTFFMFGKYSATSLEKISGERTKKAISLVKSNGGEIKSIYALLGNTDLVIIVDLPGIEAAMKVAVAMAKATGIAFVTAPAVEVDQFDKLLTGS